MVRTALLLLVLGVCSVAFGRELPLGQRVEAQRALEQVLWSHRTWPADNPGPKPPLSAVLSEEDLRAKVEASLRHSALLESWWRAPLKGDDLQAEIDRMSRDTKSPEVLRELFAALGDDPFLIAEALARPLVAERRAAALYAADERIHGAQRAVLEAKVAAVDGLTAFERLDGIHTQVSYVLDNGRIDELVSRSGKKTIVLASEEWSAQGARIAAAFDLPTEAFHEIAIGTVSRLRDLGDRFEAEMVHEMTSDRVTLDTIAWPKRPYEEWMRDNAALAIPSAEPLTPPDGGYHAEASLTFSCTYDTWSPLTAVNAPSARDSHTAVWTGAEMIVWGGTTTATGGRYTPATDTWTPTSTVSAPSARLQHTGVWTGTVMVVWGGQLSFVPTNTGGRYNPASNSWSATSTGAGAPSARWDSSSVWTGSEMIVWGGIIGTISPSPFNTGGRYNPNLDSWTPTSTGANVPSARSMHSAVWTGSLMIVWAGWNGTTATNTGGRYNAASDTWTPTSTGANVPTSRIGHRAIWTGTEMITFGSGAVPNGGRYNPASDTWATLAAGPSTRQWPSLIWTGSDMIVWGGNGAGGPSSNGGRYVPVSNVWPTTSLTTGSGANVPAGRYMHTAVYTGTASGQMIVWGGHDSSAALNTGGLYCAGQCVSGQPCNDGNACTVNDQCSGGICVGSLPPAVQFCSTAAITIPSGPGAATPYPSPLSVTAGPTVCKVRVVLDGISHTFPDDIDMMLAGPAGQNAKIMSDVGGSQDIGGLFLALDDSAASSIPDGGPLFAEGLAPLGGGTFKPTDVNDGPDTFPAPAPAPAGGSALSVFNGTNPNGTWRLWIVDDKSLDSGSLNRWCLDISYLCTADAQCPNDGEFCTDDVCVNGACAHRNNSLPCDDGDNCTSNDTCGDGFCSGTFPTAPPPEVQGVLVAPDEQTIHWSPAFSALYYEVARGAVAALPVGPGGGDEVCFPNVPGTSIMDGTLPAAGASNWYVIRGGNCAGIGIFGFQSNGNPRITTTCP